MYKNKKYRNKFLKNAVQIKNLKSSRKFLKWEIIVLIWLNKKIHSLM